MKIDQAIDLIAEGQDTSEIMTSYLESIPVGDPHPHPTGAGSLPSTEVSKATLDQIAATGDDKRLPNASNFLPPQEQAQLPYSGGPEATVFSNVRAGGQDDMLEMGQQVHLSKRDAQAAYRQGMGGSIRKDTIPAQDVLWLGDKWVYAPKEVV